MFEQSWEQHETRQTIFYYMSDYCIKNKFDKIIEEIDELCLYVVNIISDITSNVYYQIYYDVFVWITKIKAMHTKNSIKGVTVFDIEDKFKKIINNYDNQKTKDNIKTKLKDKSWFPEDYNKHFPLFVMLMLMLEEKEEKKYFFYMTYMTYYNRATSYFINLILKHIAYKIDNIENDNDQILAFYWSYKFYAIKKEAHDIIHKYDPTNKDNIKDLFEKSFKILIDAVLLDMFNVKDQNIKHIQDNVGMKLKKMKSDYDMHYINSSSWTYNNELYWITLSTNNKFNGTGTCSCWLWFAII